MQAQMLAPAAVLIAWTLIMLFWMVATRLPAMKAMGGGVGTAKPGGRGRDLEGRLPDKVNWKAHNHDHLMEQPTIFYPAVIILAIMGATTGDIVAAWIYVGLRIVHSVYQSTVNMVKVRLVIFTFATLALVYLAVRAVIATLFHNPGVFA